MIGEIDQILEDEGFESKPYQDHLKNWTFGHGLTFITKAESKVVVNMRLEAIREQINGQLHWFPNQPEEVQNILLNMAYQLGVAGLYAFTNTLSHIRSQNYRHASIEMLRSKWADQTPNRAERLSERMRRVRA